MPFLPGLKMKGRKTLRAEVVAVPDRLALQLELSSQCGRQKPQHVLATPCSHPESHSMNSISPAFNTSERPGVSSVVLKLYLPHHNGLQSHETLSPHKLSLGVILSGTGHRKAKVINTVLLLLFLFWRQTLVT